VKVFFEAGFERLEILKGNLLYNLLVFHFWVYPYGEVSPNNFHFKK